MLEQNPNNCCQAGLTKRSTLGTVIFMKNFVQLHPNFGENRGFRKPETDLTC